MFSKAETFCQTTERNVFFANEAHSRESFQRPARKGSCPAFVVLKKPKGLTVIAHSFRANVDFYGIKYSFSFSASQRITAKMRLFLAVAVLVLAFVAYTGTSFFCDAPKNFYAVFWFLFNKIV